MNNYVPANANFLTVQPDNFTQAAANAIASNCVPGRLLDAPPKAADVRFIPAKKDSKMLARPPAALVVNHFVVGATQQAALARQRHPTDARYVRPA
ncbi:MAG TPA: hypothetical protein VMF66_08505 [Candidatus Acidoferrum sp.]|nr:hypothetical protein [Candidatus Acidoferrum sp.]